MTRHQLVFTSLKEALLLYFLSICGQVEHHNQQSRQQACCLGWWEKSQWAVGGQPKTIYRKCCYWGEWNENCNFYPKNSFKNTEKIKYLQYFTFPHLFLTFCCVPVWASQDRNTISLVSFLTRTAYYHERYIILERFMLGTNQQQNQLWLFPLTTRTNMLFEKTLCCLSWLLLRRHAFIHDPHQLLWASRRNCTSLMQLTFFTSLWQPPYLTIPMNYGVIWFK